MLSCSVIENILIHRKQLMNNMSTLFFFVHRNMPLNSFLFLFQLSFKNSELMRILFVLNHHLASCGKNIYLQKNNCTKFYIFTLLVCNSSVLCQFWNRTLRHRNYLPFITFHLMQFLHQIPDFTFSTHY